MQRVDQLRPRQCHRLWGRLEVEGALIRDGRGENDIVGLRLAKSVLVKLLLLVLYHRERWGHEINGDRYKLNFLVWHM